MIICVPRWLCNDQIDAGTRRWAVEGLAYLTFDADVKEEFVEDEAALKALFQLSRVVLLVSALSPGAASRMSAYQALAGYTNVPVILGKQSWLHCVTLVPVVSGSTVAVEGLRSQECGLRVWGWSRCPVFPWVLSGGWDGGLAQLL